MPDAGRLRWSRRIGRCPEVGQHVYEKLLGPRLTNARASVREYGAWMLALWQVFEAMCFWAGRFLDGASQRGVIVFIGELARGRVRREFLLPRASSAMGNWRSLTGPRRW